MPVQTQQRVVPPGGGTRRRLWSAPAGSEDDEPARHRCRCAAPRGRLHWRRPPAWPVVGQSQECQLQACRWPPVSLPTVLGATECPSSCPLPPPPPPPTHAGDAPASSTFYETGVKFSGGDLEPSAGGRTTESACYARCHAKPACKVRVTAAGSSQLELQEPAKLWPTGLTNRIERERGLCCATAAAMRRLPCADAQLTPAPSAAAPSTCGKTPGVDAAGQQAVCAEEGQRMDGAGVRWDNLGPDGSRGGTASGGCR